MRGSPGVGATSIASYAIYDSDDGGPFTAFLTNTTLNSTTFTGQHGHTYSFYSVATDNLGNVQAVTAAAEATTQIIASPPPSAVLEFGDDQFTANITDGSAQVVLTRAGDPSATVSVVLSSTGGHDVAAFQQTITFGPNTTSETFSIPISNDGQPDESDVYIPLTLSSPGPGATLGATVSANLVIHDNNPLPSPVTVISLEPVTIRFKVGKGKRAKTKSEKGLQLQFSGALAGTGNLGAYQLLAGTIKKHVTTYSKRVPLSIYSSTPSTVTLIPSGSLKPSLTRHEELRITAADLIDAFGRPLNGGQNSVTTFGDTVVTDIRVRSQTRPEILPTHAVDAALARIEEQHRSRPLRAARGELYLTRP